MSDRTFYNLSVRQNYFRYTDMVYDDFYDARYDEAGPPLQDWLRQGVYIQGVDLGRFEQKTNALVVKGALSTQANTHHLLKVGGEVQFPRITFGVPGYLDYTTGSLVRHMNEPPDFPGVQTYEPIMAAAYAQDQIEWSDLTVRAGSPGGVLRRPRPGPERPREPGQQRSAAPRSPTSARLPRRSLSRRGSASPIRSRTGPAIHFAYGHFYQFPGLGDIFTNANYSILSSPAGERG